MSTPSADAETVAAVPGGHVGQDDAVAFAQTADDFDGVDRAAPEFHLHALGGIGLLGRAEQLEQAHRAALLPERRAPDIQDVIQPFEFNRAIHAQVRPCPPGQRSGERDVHEHRAVLRGGIDARDAPFDLAVPGIDGRLEANLEVLGLRFRNPQLRLEPPGRRHTREIRTDCDALANLDRHDLQYARDACPYLEGLDLAAAQLVERPPLCDPRLLRGELRLCRVAANLETLLLDAMTVLELVGLDPRDLRGHRRL